MQSQEADTADNLLHSSSPNGVPLQLIQKLISAIKTHAVALDVLREAIVSWLAQPGIDPCLNGGFGIPTLFWSHDHKDTALIMSVCHAALWPRI